MNTEFQNDVQKLKQSLKEYINKRKNEGAQVDGFNDNIFTLDDENDEDLENFEKATKEISVSITKRKKPSSTLTSPLKGKPNSIQFLLESESFLNEMTMIEELSRDTKTVLKRKHKLNRLSIPPNASTTIQIDMEDMMPSPISASESLPPVTSLTSPLKRQSVIDLYTTNQSDNSTKHVSFALQDEVQEFHVSEADDEEWDEIGPFKSQNEPYVTEINKEEKQAEEEEEEGEFNEEQINHDNDEEGSVDEETKVEGYDSFQRAKEKFELLKPFYTTNDKMQSLNNTTGSSRPTKAPKRKKKHKIHNNRKPTNSSFNHLHPDDLVNLITKTLNDRPKIPYQKRRIKKRSYTNSNRIPTLSLSSLLDSVPKHSSKRNCKYLIGRSKRKERPVVKKKVPLSKANTYRATHLLTKKKKTSPPKKKIETNRTPALFSNEDDLFASALFGESSAPVYPPSLDVIETSRTHSNIVSKEEEPQISSNPENYNTDAQIHHIQTLRSYM